MSKILLSQIDIDELVDMIATRVVELTNQKNGVVGHSSDLLTRHETAELLSISLATLRKWTKDCKVQQYGIGNRVYYKRSEVLNSLQAI